MRTSGVRATLFAAGIAAGLAVVAAAVPAAGQGAGSGATTVLRIPPAPRPLALGNAMVAVRDAWSLEYNPAAGAVSGATAAAAYQALPVDASAGAAVVAAPVGRSLTMGLSLRFVDYGRVDVLEPDPSLPIGRPTGETASGGEQTVLAGGSLRLGPVRLGLAGRWLRMDIDRLSDNAVAADAGLVVRVAPWLDLGASVQNLGGDVEAGRAAPLPRAVRGGAALHRDLGPVGALLAVETRRREARTGVGAGLELTGGSESIAAVARLGYESRAAPGDAYARFVFGGGVRVDRLAVDLAYRALGPLGSTRQVGVAYRF